MVWACPLEMRVEPQVGQAWPSGRCVIILVAAVMQAVNVFAAAKNYTVCTGVCIAAVAIQRSPPLRGLAGPSGVFHPIM